MVPDSSTNSLFHQVRIYFEGDAYFDAALKAIAEAKDEILCETYIFDLDPIGQEFLEAFAEARRRGVEVHLMVDGVGSLRGLQSLHNFCEKNRIDFRVFHPPLFLSRRERQVRTRPFSLSLWLSNFAQALQNFVRFVNKRNHRKVLLIDQSRCFLGSLNITQMHSRRCIGAQAWRDTGVELLSRFPLIPVIRAFQRTWLRARDLGQIRFRFRRRGPRLRRPRQSVFRINDRFRDRYRQARDLRRRIRQAQKRILITNAYFLPRRSLKRALARAAARGVYVGLCLPAVTDVWMVREAGRTLFRRLIKSGVHVFEYQPAVLHAKTMVIDDWALIGSHNLNHRSFMHDLEIEVSFEDPTPVQEMIRAWDRDIAQSHIVTLRELDRDTWLRRGIGQLAYLIRYWM